MKALVLYEKKDGATDLRDIPRPDVGEGDVLIKVKAAGICAADIDFYRAKATEMLRPPVILGHEFCGVVEGVGSDDVPWKVGDRVVSENTGYVCGNCFACLTGKYLLCPERKGIGYSMDGGFAEYVRIPSQIVHRMPDCLHLLPDKVSFREGAVLEPAANAYKTVVQEGGLKAGETIVVVGPGPIGLFSVQMAVISGASRIFLVARSHRVDRIELGKKLGVDTIVLSDKQDVGEAIMSATNGEGVDVVVDTVGSDEVMTHAMNMVRPEGCIVRIAWNNIPATIGLDQLSNRSATIQGHYGYDYISWRNTIRLAEKGRINFEPMISRIFTLDQWREAFQMVENKSVLKAVFEMDTRDAKSGN